ncbi:NUDIX domain-containing protein [Nocardioides rotundus]|nr:NUDIX domain-containing protein [Nocardioides rotundus]
MVSAVAFVRDGAVLTVRKEGTSRFMLVGGKLEPGESPADAAVRETREEVGVEIAEPELLGDLLAEAANEPGHLVRSSTFLADLPEGAEPVAAGEIAEVRWVPLAAAAAGEYDDLAPLLEHRVLPLLLARLEAEEPAQGEDR